MATQNFPAETPVSLEASAAITPYRFVKDVAGGKVANCSVAGEAAAGVAIPSYAGQTSIDAGSVAAVIPLQPVTVVMEAGAAVADGANVMTDAVGRAVTATVGLQILGKVVNGSSAAAVGDKISVRLHPIGTKAA